MIGKPRGLRLKRAMLALLTAFLVLYMASYHYLSRRGMAEAKRVGTRLIFYVPLREALTGQDSPAYVTHHRLRILYSPINYVDRVLFGGPDPVRHIMWGISSLAADPE